MKILLVEDDLFLQELYTDILSGAGYTVTSSVDGRDALSKMQEGGYDLVLLDLHLPTLSGLEIARQVHTSPPKIPNNAVIFLTNSDDGEAMEQAKEYGYGYLIKSELQPDEFLERIKTYLPK